ncbi:hypothetical protein [Novosphingopyxis baekryungensis]|uniref:hypothetical protein n=1 Tax=Novosphingopyxis baekryungensis TaxID=279369 RepID=UPI0003B59E6B|nr:hypothetical protein [Novosphingopyxis baekryungensis]
MYSETDLQSAVAAGAISAEAADSFRAHISTARQSPMVDEEQFRLLTGFNDIFVAIAVVIMLVAVGGIGQALTPVFDGPPPFAGLFVAGAAWGLAEFFTRKRRMALPSIILLLAFVGGLFEAWLGFGFMTGIFESGSATTNNLGEALWVALSALLTGGGAWLHWRRFHVPITITAGAAALAGTVAALIVSAIGANNQDLGDIMLAIVFLLGLAVFAFAMWWDMSDRQRESRRSDVAFWLHLLAAPMIAHPLFSLLGVTDGGMVGVAGAIGVIAVYLLFAIVALAIDRRALLVSALAYVLFALTELFRQFGVVEFNVALTALVIGSALLTLSAFWTPIRQMVVERLPGTWQARLPISGLVVA